MKTYYQMNATEKRQAVLDALHQHGGMCFGDLKTLLGATQSLTSVLNTMYLRGEIDQAGRISGNKVIWVPLVDTTAPMRMGPEPAGKRIEPPRDPGVRVVRLLDKPNTARGGQCSNVVSRGIQSSMQSLMECAGC